MSDGPHRSLNMSLGWRRLAKRADNSAFDPEEVRDALPAALESDWRTEMPAQVLTALRQVVDDRQGSMFGNDRRRRLEELRAETAGHPLCSTLLDFAVQAVEGGLTGDAAFRDIVKKTLCDRAARGVRQVEEHYLRKATLNRASHVRRRIEQGINLTDMPTIASAVLKESEANGRPLPDRKTGLDDGVRL